MNLVPPADRVLCRLVEPEAFTAFGLELPEQARERPVRAVVLAVGAGTPHPSDPEDTVPLGLYEDSETGFLNWLDVGDEVILPRVGGSEITDDEGETVISILASEILARVCGGVGVTAAK